MLRAVPKERFRLVAEERGWLHENGTLHPRAMMSDLGLSDSNWTHFMAGKYGLSTNFFARLWQVTNLPYRELFEDVDFADRVDPERKLRPATREKRAQKAYREAVAEATGWKPRQAQQPRKAS